MARAELFIEDADGSIHFRLRHEGGYRADSPAHKLANMVVKFLDEQASKKTEIEVDQTPPEPSVLTHESTRRILMANGEHL